MNKIKMPPEIINSAGFLLTGLLSLTYIIFEITFAELHISFKFFDFPVFIGEILFLFCGILYITKSDLKNDKIRKLDYILCIYFLFVVIKAGWGYVKWGPLALRHAAMCYYPLFAVFSFSFFESRYLKNKYALAFLLILLLAAICFSANTNYKFICFILGIALIKAFPKGAVKYALLTGFLLFTPYKSFFSGLRTMWVSNIVSIAVAIFLLSLIWRIKTWLKIGLYAFVAVMLCFVCSALLDRNALDSITNLRENMRYYTFYRDKISQEENSFISAPLKRIRIYNQGVVPDEEHPARKTDNEHKTDKMNKQQLAQKTQGRTQPPQVGTEKQVHLPLMPPVVSAQSNTVAKDPDVAPPRAFRSSDTVYVNTYFRIFIWRDLLRELAEKKPVFGFDFGKPFRSKSIEIINIAHGEWTRDGWVAVHNSYLEMIYRSGIVGILFIIIIFLCLFRMIKSAIVSRSVTGILLCTALINWLVAAGFMLVFELPYKAVPFWILFGFAFAYLRGEKQNVSYQETDPVI